MTRRDFIKNSAIAGGVVTFGAPLFSSCVSTIDSAPDRYPKLPGHKIQSPEHYGIEGCMTGFWPGWQPNRTPYGNIKNYEEKAGKPPSIKFIRYQLTGIPIPFGAIDRMIETAENGTIPFVTYDGRYHVGQKKNNILNEVLAGKHDRMIKRAAIRLRKAYGEKYGGFFIRFFREMNIDSWGGLWGLQPKKFKKAYNHIGDIFDHEGAAEYATFVWNPYSVYWKGTKYSNLESYYPGDKYVDWIGLNAYNHNLSQSFQHMLGSNIRWLHKRHPNKPIMIAEYGIDENPYKARFVKEAFERTKIDFPEVRALLWWDENWKSSLGGVDSRIDSSEKALAAFRVEIADPYFLGTVPYRKKLSL